MDDIDHPVVKASVALVSFVGITWIDWITTSGKIAAALVSIGLFVEFAWKKVIKPTWRYLRNPDEAT